MADVIHLKDHPPPQRRTPSRVPREEPAPEPSGARILLFTGVRYERYATEPAPDLIRQPV